MHGLATVNNNFISVDTGEVRWLVVAGFRTNLDSM